MIGVLVRARATLAATPANRRRAQARPYAPTALFAAGYLLDWVGFSVAATLAQGAWSAPPCSASGWHGIGGVLLAAYGIGLLVRG